MLKFRAENFIDLGRQIETISAEFGGLEAAAEIDNEPIKPLEGESRQKLAISLNYLHIHCLTMGLKVSAAILKKHSTENLPATQAAFRF